MTSTNTVWLTPEAYERLHDELNTLRRQVIPVAGESDTDTDADTDVTLAQKARIRELEDILNHAVVGQDPANDGVAEPGMVLTVRYEDTKEEETFLLGLRSVEHRRDDSDLEVYSPTSPLGEALIGARPGETRSYQVPSGATLQVTLLDAVPYGQYAQRAAAAQVS